LVEHPVGHAALFGESTPRGSNHSWLRRLDPATSALFGRGRSNLAHIIGTSVIDTIAEMMIVTAIVIANARNITRPGPTNSALTTRYQHRDQHTVSG